MENMFSQNNALQTIKLGERFRFNGSSNASWLPGLYWTRLSTGDEYESSELARVYDGSTMAGTYTNSREYTQGLSYHRNRKNFALEDRSKYYPEGYHKTSILPPIPLSVFLQLQKPYRN